MQSESIIERPQLKSIDFLRLLDQARKELGVRALYLSGAGETFLIGQGDYRAMLKNYKRLVEHVNELGMDIIQFTNGYFLTREMVEFLKEYRVSIVVSIDALNAERYRRLTGTGPGVFQKVIDNIQFARTRLPITLSGGQHLYRLGINMAISHLCKDDIKSMMSFCGDDIIFFSNYPLIKGSFKENIEQMCLTEDEYKRFIQLCCETSAYKGLAGLTSNNVCGFLRYGLTLDYDGHVLICPYDVDSGRLFGYISHYESMQEAYKMVQKRLLKFAHGRHNALYCPLRHKEYHNF
jgi:MoaA/NifB/PqqE/SkfB family radical SAM enzyme